MKACWLLVVAACSGSNARRGTWTPATPPRASAAIDDWTVADDNAYVRHACKNVVDGNAFRCPQLGTAGQQPSQCIETFSDLRGRAAGDKERRAFRHLVLGLAHADSCDGVAAAFQRAAASMHEGEELTTCRKRPDGALDLTADEMLLRRGLGARLFEDVPSAVDKPIEVCGIYGQVSWLTRVTCADGSRPWGRDLHKAHGARGGSTSGAIGGGRCGDTPIIDVYRVPCPEKTYEVFMNMYVCGPGEELRRGMRRPGS